MVKGIAGLSWSVLMAILILSKDFSGGTVIKKPPANTEDARDMGSIPRSGKIPSEEEMAIRSSIVAGKIP